MHLHHAGVPIHSDLFEAVGQIHGIGKTTVSKWYYFHKNKRTPTYRIFERQRPFPPQLEAVKSELLPGGAKLPRSRRKRGITREV